MTESDDTVAAALWFLILILFLFFFIASFVLFIPETKQKIKYVFVNKREKNSEIVQQARAARII